MNPGEPTGSANSSEGGNNQSRNNSGGNSPARESQPQAQGLTQAPPIMPQSPPQQIQQQQLQQQQLQQQLQQSLPPSAPHSRNPSFSQPIHLQNPTPEEKPNLATHTSTPPFFEHSPSNGISTSLPNILSPLSTPGNGFMSHTPMSGYEDFVRTNTNSDEASPHFMNMDPWTSMPMGNDFDSMRIDPALMMSMGMDMSMGPPDSMLTMIPEMTPPQPFGSVQTPIQTPLQTPRVDETFSDLQIGSSAYMFNASNRHVSAADTTNQEHSTIIAAQEGWTVFRCTPSIPSSNCPTTARLNLEFLEQTLKNHDWWTSWDDGDYPSENPVAVVPITDLTREKLLAITQVFLHKALDIHRDGTTSSPGSGESPGSNASNFILLPPAQVLESCFRSFVNSSELYFPLVSCGKLDVNELIESDNLKASSLLILMMIAQGAMHPFGARWLVGGLTEVCRISLFDLVEKNIIMAGHPLVLRAALLFTVQAAWSGDKWQMDIAMGQRGMYFAMLRHSGILETNHDASIHINRNAGPDELWAGWTKRESESR